MTGVDGAGRVPLDRRGFRLAMGLRPLDLARWLEVDDNRQAELAEKRRLLVSARHRVVATLPGSEPAAAELLDAVVANLEQHHAGVISVDADGMITDSTSGVSVNPVPPHPLETAARIVQEDLCLMERRDGSWVLSAANVCFPSRWDLPSKLGRTLSGIHRPVPGYEDVLSAPVDAYFERLRPDRPTWRLNWTLVDRPDLHLVEPASRYGDAPPEPGRQLWFRVERQTLRRITDRPAITFTIRTYVTRLDQLCDVHPEAVECLRTSLTTASAETVAYKGWGALLGPLLEWLDERAAAI